MQHRDQYRKDDPDRLFLMSREWRERIRPRQMQREPFCRFCKALGDPFYRFTREINDEEPITTRFPEATLDLMNVVTPLLLNRAPYELPKVLALVAEADPLLTSDPRYLRLIDLIEQS